MAEIIDHIVKISIEDAVSSVSTVGVNTIAVVGKVGEGKTGAAAGEYTSAGSALASAYGSDSELFAMVDTIFNQPTQPAKVVCIPCAGMSDALDKIKAAAGSFSFYHIVVATDDGDVTGTALANDWETWLNKVHKVAHIQVKTGAATIVAALKAKTAKHVAVYQHTEKWTVGDDSWTEYLHAALVGFRCGKDSARGSFAHKKVVGITADSYSEEDFTTLTAAGVNIYTEVSGEARVFFGTTCDNTHFIDQVVKDDWIRFNVQSRIYKLLGEANDGYGVNYDDAGIGSVAAAVLNVLSVASDSDHQYVLENGYEVNYKPYSYLKENYPDEVRKRNLPLISGKYARMGSVNTVQEVSLEVTL